MMRKMMKKAGALLVVGMTMVGMLGTAITTVNAADDTFSVDINDVEFNDKYSNEFDDEYTGQYINAYHIKNPIVHIPTNTVLTYMTINVRNGYFNTSALSAWGVHHYNAGGSAERAYSDLVILNDGYKSATKIEEFLENMPLAQSESNLYKYDESISSTADRLQIEVEISNNAVNIPSTYSYNYYKDISTQKTYLYLYNKDAAGISWHDAYNAAKQVEFSNMRGYLMADNPNTDSSFNDHLLRTGGRSEDDNLPAGWVGVTSLYNVTNGTSTTTFDKATWNKNTDGTTWANTISGSQYVSPLIAGHTEDDTVTNVTWPNTTYVHDVTVNPNYWDKNSTASADAAQNNVTHYYLADGPDTGKNFANHNDWYIRSQRIYYYGQYGYYDQSRDFWIQHYEPDNLSNTEYSNSTLTRADKTSKLDCAIFYQGALADSAEADVKKAFYVEFTASDSYANSFVTGDQATYEKGIAKTTYNADKDYTAENNMLCTFKSYLLMDSDATVPAIYFNYDVQSVKGTADNKVFTGIDNLTATGRITSTSKNRDGMAASEFRPTDTVINYDTAPTNDKEAIHSALHLSSYAGKKFAVSEVSIDFSNVKFHEPGIYRFKVSQRNNEERYIKYDPVSDLILDVYVESADGNEQLQIVNYIFHTDKGDTIWQDGENKVSQTKRPYFVNQYLTDTLKVTKTVSGNQARTDQYFKFKVRFMDTAPAAVISAKFTDTASTSDANSLNYTLKTSGITIGDANSEIPSSGNSSGALSTTVAGYWKTFYLKANESVTFVVPNGVKYQVAEDEDTLNTTGYKSTLASVEGDNNSYYVELTEALTMNENHDISDDGISQDTVLTINNEKNGLVPTGIIVTVAPYAALAIGGFFGLILFARHKKNEDEDDDSEEPNVNHKH